MKNIKAIIAVAALSLSCAAMAQNTESAYFTDGHLYRHNLNPAFGGENGYVSMPFLGNMNVGMSGNIGVENVLFNRNGKLVTFMHPDISYSEAMDGINDQNKLNEDLKMQLLSIGFKGLGGYNTIDVTMHEQLSGVLPKELFDIFKGGITNREYNLGGINFNAQAYVEIALGHSHKINDNLRIGAKLKALLGAGNVDFNLNNATLSLLSNGVYTATVDGEVHGNVAGLQVKNKAGQVITNGTADNKYDDVKVDGAGLGGFGLAVDLGAEYKLNDNFSFSAAVLDLGFINWKNDVLVSAKGTHTLDTRNYQYDMDEKKYWDGTREINDAFEDFKDVYDLRVNGDQGSRKTNLAATVNVGAEYKTPFYDKLSFGLLGTFRMNGDYSWNDFRLSANVAPAKIFSAGINLHTGTFGTGFGWIVDFHPKGFNLFLAMDHTPTKLAKQFVPLNSNAEFSMGINFPF